MPAADQLFSAVDLNDVDETPSASELGAFTETSPLPVPTGKSKKKSKKKSSAQKARLIDDGEDSPPYAQSITPSPPADQGARLLHATAPSAPSPLPSFVPEPDGVDSEVPEPIPETFEQTNDQSAGFEDIESYPVESRSPKPTPASISTRQPKSPRPTAVWPAATQALSGSSNVAGFSPPSHLGNYRHPSQNHIAPHRSGPQSAQTHDQSRRESNAAFQPPRSRFVDPPPPHLPQAHFWTLPDLGFNLNQKSESGKPAGSDGYCCCLGSFSDAGDESSALKARDALLVGCEGGLEVFRILPNKLEVVGRLEGLRGAVIDARIVPHVSRFDVQQPLRPLVVVVIHGPSADDRQDSGAETDDLNELDMHTSYQTSVEVFSLQTQQHVATLFKTAKLAVERTFAGQIPPVPDPIGDLTLTADGKFIVVASGKSGEVFVFTDVMNAGLEELQFRCVGKFWTALQVNNHVSATRPLNGGEGTALEQAKESPRVPIFSLKKRWLAIVSPVSSSHMSIQGAPILADVNPHPPFLATHVTPAQPVISCDVVGTDAEDTWSRLGRQAAQGLVKYSQKGIEMGLQGWKELTQPSPPGRPTHNHSSSRDDAFPPTKGPVDDPGRLAKEPAVVSILDLDSLLVWEEHKSKHLPLPLATFALVEGCSFLSFSSTGTRLLTSTRKGEMSTVWDLAQVAHGMPERRGPTSDSHGRTGPCIRQLHRIIRNSPSTVLSCAWSRDDDALALLTSHGTVHLHEVLLRPASKKRKRRSTTSANVGLEKADATVSLSTGLSPPSSNQGFLGSIKSGWQTVSTQVNSIRSSNPASALGLPITFAGFREATAAAGNAGSRAVARGISQGYTAAKGGASDYWHADDNKIRHKALQDPTFVKSIKWMQRHNTISLAIVCGGSVYLHPVQRVTRRKGDAIVSGLKHERYSQKTFALPPITTRADGITARIDHCTSQGPHGFWSLRNATLRSTHTPAAAPSPAAKLLLQTQINDVETNPPYCPFHIDSRVNIYSFGNKPDSRPHPHTRPNRSISSRDSVLDQFQYRGHGSSSEDPWTFGDALPSNIKINDCVVDDSSDEADYDLSNPKLPRPFPTEYDDDDDDDEELDNPLDPDDPDAPHQQQHLANQVESRLTLEPLRASSGMPSEPPVAPSAASPSRRGAPLPVVEQQIRINTRRKQLPAKIPSASSAAAAAAASGGFRAGSAADMNPRRRKGVSTQPDLEFLGESDRDLM